MASVVPLNSIPPSRDTIFMRGFSARQHIDDIREFFQHEGARNTVEFFKDDGNQQLFVALRFDTKTIAQDIINRYDNTDILGDRVQMQFYKDLRRAHTDNFRPYMNNNNRNKFHDDQYDFRRNDRNDRRDDRGGFNARRGGGGWQRGGGGDLKRTGGWQDRSYHQQQSVVASRPRRYTRSSSRSRSPTKSRSSSRSYSRSSSESPTRSKRRRSESAAGHKRKIYKRKAHKTVSRNSMSPDHKRSHSEDEENSTKKTSDWTSDPNTTAAAVPADKDKNNETASDTEKNAEQPAVATDPAGAQAIEGNDASESAKPPQVLRSAVVTTAAGGGGKAKRKTFRVPNDDQQLSDVGSMEADDLAMLLNNVASVKDTTKGKKNKGVAPSRRQPPAEQPAEDEGTEEEEEEEESAMILGPGRRPREPLNENFVSQKRIPKPQPSTSKAQLANEAGAPGGSFDFYDPSAEQRLPRKKKSARHDEEYMEGPFTKPRSKSSRKRPMYSDMLPNGVTMRELSPERAAFIQAEKEKIEWTAQIKAKKEEIEQAYRQDCETFALVTKMLISKDPGLEERIQHSLRDNLKEIGQRCIQELREFVQSHRPNDEDDEDVE